MIVQNIRLQMLGFLGSMCKCCIFPLYQGNVTVEPRISISVLILCGCLFLHRFSTFCAFFFSTGIKRQHVARLVESDLPRDRHIYNIPYCIYFSQLTGYLLYAGRHVPDMVSLRTEFCGAVHMVQEGIMGVCP